MAGRMCQTTTLMRRLPFRTIAVSGSSMSPTYSDGDWLIFKMLAAGKSRPKNLVGKVVVLERESYPGVYFIKRVLRSDSTGYWVEGDNSAASTDSRQWGAVSTAEIIGLVLLRYRRGKINE